MSLKFKGPSFTKRVAPCNREMAKELPLVSIVVVNFNDKEHLHRCLNSVMKSKYPSFEIILVDNGSTDGSIDSIKRVMKEQPDLKLSIICNKENIGPAAARNIGAKKSCGGYLAFLDSDTKVDPFWLNEAIKVMDSDSTIGAIQCKLLLLNSQKRFDYAGDYLSPFGILVQRVNLGEPDDGRYDNIVEIFGVKSAAMLIRREVFEAVGMFDDDYFIYGEETDLCWRVWLSGYRIVFAPTSKVYHNFNLVLKSNSNRPRSLDKYHGTKNYISSLIKNFGLWNLVKVLPLNLSIWIGISIWYVLKRRLNWATYVMKGVLYNLIHFKQIWKKRLRVQYLTRKVPDNYIMSRIMKKTSPAYFYNKVLRPGGWRA